MQKLLGRTYLPFKKKVPTSIATWLRHVNVGTELMDIEVGWRPVIIFAAPGYAGRQVPRICRTLRATGPGRRLRERRRNHPWDSSRAARAARPVRLRQDGARCHGGEGGTWRASRRRRRSALPGNDEQFRFCARNAAQCLRANQVQ